MMKETTSAKKCAARPARSITISAAIAALYVLLTLLANVFGLSSMAIQLRFSEALTVLPVFTPAAIPGLFFGCLLANFLTGGAPWDIVIGSAATLLAAILTWLLGKIKWGKWIAALPPILCNTIAIPPVLAYVYHLDGTLPFFALTVFLGELISCGGLGMALLVALSRIPRSQNLLLDE